MAMNNFVARRKERLREKRKAREDNYGGGGIDAADAEQKRDKAGKFASSAGSNAMRAHAETKGFKPLHPATKENLGTSVHQHKNKGFLHIHDNEAWGHETPHYNRGPEIGGVTHGGQYNPKMVQGQGLASMAKHLRQRQ